MFVKMQYTRKPAKKKETAAQNAVQRFRDVGYRLHSMFCTPASFGLWMLLLWQNCTKKGLKVWHPCVNGPENGVNVRCAKRKELVY